MTIKRNQGGAWVNVAAIRTPAAAITFGRRRVGGAWVDWWGGAATAVTFAPANSSYQGTLSGSGTTGPAIVATAVGGAGPFTWTAVKKSGGAAQITPNFTAQQPGNTLNIGFTIYSQTSGNHSQVWTLTATNAQGSVSADIEVIFNSQNPS